MDFTKAQKLCHDVAEDRRRWGRHGGFNNYSKDEVLDALVVINDMGYFELGDERDQRVAANRARGAAEARAHKYKAQLDDANNNILELTKALEAAEKRIENMQLGLE